MAGEGSSLRRDLDLPGNIEATDLLEFSQSHVLTFSMSCYLIFLSALSNSNTGLAVPLQQLIIDNHNCPLVRAPITRTCHSMSWHVVLCLVIKCQKMS